MRFLTILYNILFYPTQEFRVIAMGPVPKDLLLVYATIIIFLASALSVIYSPWIHTTDGLVIKLVLASITGLIFWLFTGTVFSTAAYIFGQRGRPQTLLILTAFAATPWLFLPVVSLFKGFLGPLGNSIAILGGLSIWLWSAILFLMAIKYTYSLTLERVLLVAALPMLMTFLGIAWVSGFFFNLIKFFS